MSLFAPFIRGRLAIIPGALAASALILAGCGGDDDGGGSGGGGSDEDYVATICSSFRTFADDLADLATSNPDISDEEAFEKIEGPVGDLVNEFEDANPPDDVAAYHAQLLDLLHDFESAVKDRDTDAFNDLGDLEMGDIPEDIRARLQAVADDNEDCLETGAIFGDSTG